MAAAPRRSSPEDLKMALPTHLTCTRTALVAGLLLAANPLLAPVEAGTPPVPQAPAPPAEATDREEGETEERGETPVAPAEEVVIFERLSVVGGAERIGDVPGSAHYLDLETLERQDHSDVHQVLATVPGVSVQEEEGYGLRPNIGMRGSGSERSAKITLLEDGVLIAPAPYAAPSAYYFPTTGRMQAIEVRKGSSSIRQGPYTNGGVLNLVSTAIPGRLGGQVEAMAGEDGTRRLHAYAGDTGSRLGWMLETYRMESDGFKRLDGGGPTGFELEDYVAKVRVTSSAEATLFQALEVKLGHTDQLAHETYLGLTETDFQRTPYRRYAASQEDRLDSEHEQVQVNWIVAPRQNLDVTTTVYRNDFFRNWHKLQSVDGADLGDVLSAPQDFAGELALLRGETDSAPGALRVRNNRRDYYAQGVQTVAGLRLAGRRAEHDLEIGLRWHEDEEDRFQEEDSFQMVDGRMVLTAPGAPGSQANRVSSAEALAFFLQDRVSVGRWTFTPGLRFESIDFSRVDYASTDPDRTAPARVRDNGVDVWIPGLGVDVRLGDASSLFAGVHKGFAPPGPGRNADTEPEESVNYELGWRWLGEPVAVQAVAFYSDYDNLLGRDTLSSGGSGSGDLFNGGEVEVEGLELSLDADLAPYLATTFPALREADWKVPLDVAYTYTSATFSNSFESDFEPWAPRVESGDELPYVAPHQLSVGGGVDAGGWNAFLQLSWLDEMRTRAGQGPIAAGEGTDARLLVDLSARVRLVDGLDLQARVRNLTDEVYVAARRPAGARPGLPRTALVGLHWDF
jgi:Fe(3+) dicitrate transport protein